MPRPFVRWAGSKRALTKDLVEFLPDTFGRYWEPFVGSGALYFLIEPEKATLNDSCRELIELYRAIADDAGLVSKLAASIPFNREQFYAVRANRSRERYQRAAEFLYLNRGCFNGLYRVNSSGQFNVPWGAPKTDFVVDDANIVACQSLLSKGTKLMSGDFESALKGARGGDLIFLDPPYVTRHNNQTFIDYNEKLFHWSDQIRLAAVAERMRVRGCHVLVTNANVADVISLYPHFDSTLINRSSTLASSATRRGRVSEVVLVGRRS